MPTTRAYHVNGPCLVSVGAGQDLASSLLALGVSQEGIDLQIEEYEEPVRSDMAGPRMAADVQEMGMAATISCALVDYDDAVLTSLRNRCDRLAGQPGVLKGVGRLAGTSGDLFRVVLSSADKPWRFHFCKLRGAPQRTKLSAKVTIWQVTFSAIVFVPAGTNNYSDAPLYLYDHVAA